MFGSLCWSYAWSAMLGVCYVGLLLGGLGSGGRVSRLVASLGTIGAPVLGLGPDWAEFCCPFRVPGVVRESPQVSRCGIGGAGHFETWRIPSSA
jgi:hypothetical protein